MRIAIVVAMMLGGAGCSEPPVEIRILSTAEWAQRPDARARVEALAEAGARYWGAPASALDGWTIDVVDGMFPCGYMPSVVGCAYLGSKRIVVSATDNLASPAVICAEGTALIHEIGHAAIDDINHTNPQWNQFAINAASIASVPDEDAACLAWFDGVLYP
jgi:hypothetical protein